MAGRSLRRESELLWARYLTAAQEVLGCSDIGELDLPTSPLFVLLPPCLVVKVHIYTLVGRVDDRAKDVAKWVTGPCPPREGKKI